MQKSLGYSRNGSPLSYVADVYGQRPNRLRLATQIIEAANVRPGCQLLEIGCGEGLTSAFLAEYLGAKVIGVDLESRILDSAVTRRAVGQPTPQISFCLSDAIWLPFSAGEFDCIWCESTFSTLDEKWLVVQEFRRLLKAGGKLIVLDFVLGKPVSKQLQNLISFLPCLGRTTTAKDYIAMFESSGFETTMVMDYSEEVKKSGYWLGRMFGSLDELVSRSASRKCSSTSQNSPTRPSMENFQQFLKNAQLGYFLFVVSSPM
jgi:ubiquinone/menaquinone biosynthesis C-methylase UbiE